MSASDDGIRHPSSSDYSFNPFLWEAHNRELDQCWFMATDDNYALPDYQMFPYGEEPMNDSIFQIFPLEEEMIYSDMMAKDFQDFSEGENFQTATDNSMHEAQFCNEMLPTRDVMWSEQIMNFEGAAGVGVCINGELDRKWNIGGEEEKRQELVQLVLASGRMIGKGEYDEAAILVSKCKKLSSQLGNPTERLVYYISHALQQRIQRDTLGMLHNAAKPVLDFAFNFEPEFDKKEFGSLVAYYSRVLPHIKMMQFTSVQAIIDAVGNAGKIHVIDLGMRTGSQWTVLMEFLKHRAACSSTSALKILRITAVGMNGEELRKSGKRLHELAKSFHIPFSYNMVEITNINEIREGIFNVKSTEALAVYAPIILRSLLYDPVLLVNVLCVIKNLRPRIMVTIEIEGKHNSPSFVNRLTEVLYNYSALFDLLEVTFPDRNDSKRIKHEELIDGNQIRNMMVYEGKERAVRHVTIDVWRCFFKQAGFKEMSFSFQALYQAQLLLREYASQQYYTLEPDGRALIVGWKGTPLFALSAWSGIK